MNKKDLVQAVSEKTGMTQKDVGTAMETILNTISAALQAGDDVKIAGFGVFRVNERRERIARNPRTKETITISASLVPVFNPGKALKEVVNQPFGRKDVF